jgi:hypothetical protein
VYILDINNIDIKIIPYDGTPNPRNPFDLLSDSEVTDFFINIKLLPPG